MSKRSVCRTSNRERRCAAMIAILMLQRLMTGPADTKVTMIS
jgi:hypothetical protein